MFFEVSYVKKNYYDHWLCERHAQLFSGVIFDSLEEIKIWAKTLKKEDYITKILKFNGDSVEEIYNIMGETNDSLPF